MLNVILQVLLYLQVHLGNWLFNAPRLLHDSASLFNALSISKLVAATSDLMITVGYWTFSGQIGQMTCHSLACPDIHVTLVPRFPNLFNVPHEKRGSLVKLITCVTSGGTNIHIWHGSELADLRHRISRHKFELFNLSIANRLWISKWRPFSPFAGCQKLLFA